MPKNIVEERLRWVKMTEQPNLKLVDVLKLFPYSERTLKRWLKAYRQYGLKGLSPKSTRPKSQSMRHPLESRKE